ncbi:hypothetical protein [Streptomyces sp. NPDC001056]
MIALVDYRVVLAVMTVLMAASALYLATRGTRCRPSVREGGAVP